MRIITNIVNDEVIEVAALVSISLLEMGHGEYSKSNVLVGCPLLRKVIICVNKELKNASFNLNISTKKKM